eukprot:CAMPEP_0197235034 /NCGR_PEP_ID=MMETSP1429-20130617/2578_1 /TAXON_ID=49237 /ORGANISM="Chaetoceros  sp., Strain UNC1202" /LENGTH=198 /DNA_ID=CAMNT_0042693545 /DNA_START=63 /DNA_END=659 /DNA_ORIENTATION=-
MHLEDHVVGLVAVLQGELGIQVSLEHRNGIDGLHQSGINRLLVSLALIGNNGSLGCITCEELIFLGGGGTGEVTIVDGRNIDRGYINLGGGGDDVGGTDTTEGDSVDLVRSRNEDKSRFEDLEGYNALPTETSSEEDENGSRGDGGTNLRGVLLALARMKRTLDIICGVVLSSGYGSSGLLGSGDAEYFLCWSVEECG